MKKILAINDLTTFSKCAMQITANVMSHFLVELNMLPTMLYSANLAFEEVAKLDCTNYVLETLAIYKKNNIHFDSLYLGLLVNKDIINSILQYIDNDKIYFDPIMGDNGKLYNSISLDYIDLIMPIIKKSYIIFPNLFEATTILNKEYRQYDDLELKNMLVELTNLGPKIAIITGVIKDNLIGCYLYNSESNEFIYYGLEKINYLPHGTGDLFSSIFTALKELNYTDYKCLKISVDITYKAINLSYKEGIKPLYGLNFEKVLIDELKKMSV